MNLHTPEHHTFAARLDCRYLLHVPDGLNGEAVLVVALHGYSSNPDAMLRLTAALVGDRHIIACLQGPYQHYVSQVPGAESAAGYNWGIRQHWESSIRLHHDMLAQILALLRERFGISSQRCLLLGFSQPVGMNYRFAGTHPDQVGGVIGICGGVPRDWNEDKYQTVRAPLLHISREEDEFYPPQVASDFPNRLRQHATDVEFHLIPGQHRFPSKADAIVRPWMQRVFGTADAR